MDEVVELAFEGVDKLVDVGWDPAWDHSHRLKKRLSNKKGSKDDTDDSLRRTSTKSSSSSRREKGDDKRRRSSRTSDDKRASQDRDSKRSSKDYSDRRSSRDPDSKRAPRQDDDRNDKSRRRRSYSTDKPRPERPGLARRSSSEQQSKDYDRDRRREQRSPRDASNDRRYPPSSYRGSGSKDRGLIPPAYAPPPPLPHLHAPPPPYSARAPVARLGGYPTYSPPRQRGRSLGSVQPPPPPPTRSKAKTAHPIPKDAHAGAHRYFPQYQV